MTVVGHRIFACFCSKKSIVLHLPWEKQRTSPKEFIETCNVFLQKRSPKSIVSKPTRKHDVEASRLRSRPGVPAYCKRSSGLDWIGFVKHGLDLLKVDL